MNTFGLENQLISEGSNSSQIDDNLIVQCFSPIITSHRIMNCQFGNSYYSIKCEDNLLLYFEEYMGYLFVAIGKENEEYMKKFTNLCVTVVRYLCGPDVYQLKANHRKSVLANKILDAWISLDLNDQAIHVEAVEQLIVNTDLTSATIRILRESVDSFSAKVECKKMHALVLVQNKFLSLYSSPTAKELSPADIIFLTILSQSKIPEKPENEGNLSDILSYLILLAGPEGSHKCLPHIVHIASLTNGIFLIYLIEIGNPGVAASLYETFCHFHIMQQVQIQRDKEILQPAFENLDLANRKLNDSLKKNKNSTVEVSHKQLTRKWEVIKKKYQEYLKSSSEEALLRAETLGLGFLENLKELLGLTSVDESILTSSAKYIRQVANIVGEKMEIFEEFFKVKGIRNFSLGSRDSLTINKYLEEFPGLVHFLYIDRNTHRITTPTPDFSTEEGSFSKKKIWFLIDFARKYLQRGCMQLMWKDTTFHYAYFMWFEDTSGAPLKPSVFPDQISALPGIMCEDFYQKLKGMCFPKMQPSKNRRLAATISELRGHPSQATDFL
ncbi:hypothetical protein JTB14_002400 [Gonioctena quinquepunctata]|nr:hypothetical protein JTB14_002400 [Gonioctena quinquepunctata]